MNGDLCMIIFHLLYMTEYVPVTQDTVCEYHIGTKIYEDTVKIVNTLKSAGLNAYVNDYFSIH